jgi:hypothetical protein
MPVPYFAQIFYKTYDAAIVLLKEKAHIARGGRIGA